MLAPSNRKSRCLDHHQSTTSFIRRAARLLPAAGFPCGGGHRGGRYRVDPLAGRLAFRLVGADQFGVVGAAPDFDAVEAVGGDGVVVVVEAFWRTRAMSSVMPGVIRS